MLYHELPAAYVTTSSVKAHVFNHG